MAKRPIYYDTETTGIRKESDRIIEIAAYDPVEERTFCEFINPGFPIPPEATAIHNITDEMVQNAPGFDVVGKAFVEFCQGDVVLVAHNNDAFDKPFLEAEFGKFGMELPEMDYLDSLKWARKYRPDLPRHALQVLREVYGIPENQAHRALDDVMVLYEVFKRMIGDLSFEMVLELMKKKNKALRMPFGKHQGKPLSEVPENYVKWLLKNDVLDKPGNEELKAAFLELVEV